MKHYISKDKFMVGNKSVYIIDLQNEIYTLEDIRGKAFLDNQLVNIIGVEVFMHHPPWHKGELIVIMLENEIKEK